MAQLKLYMLLLGCKPPGRHTEQHDIFFGIGESVKGLVPQINSFWPDAGKIHIDAWREINVVDGHVIEIHETEGGHGTSGDKLFFLNLGGYKQNEFEEYHYKMLTVAADKSIAIKRSKETAFYKHTGFKGAESHIDDKFGIDVDDIYEIPDILPAALKQKYFITIGPSTSTTEDEVQLGYFPLSKL